MKTTILHHLRGLPILGVAIGSLLLSTSAVQAQTIYNADSIISTGSRQNVDGTALGLSANAPGGTWVWGYGWDWAAPFIPATWDPPGLMTDEITLSNERTVLSLSLASAGSYVKPAQFTVSSSFYLTGNFPSTNTALLGFWSTQPTQVDNVSSLTDFTGLTITEAGQLTLVVNGTTTAETANVGGLTENVYYTLSYSVDTSTGAISNITFDNSSISGITSTGFTDAATTAFGIGSSDTSRVGFDALSVEGIQASVPEPSTVWLMGLGFGFLVLRLRNKKIA